jgi:hypothetical protein
MNEQIPTPQAVRIYPSLDAMRSAPGPAVPHYALPLDAAGAVYRWASSSSAAEDSWTVIVPTGGGFSGAWIRMREDSLGEPITGTATLTVGGRQRRRIAAAALSASATLTLSTVGAVAGDTIAVTRLDVGAYTVAFVNGGPAAGTLATMPISARAFVRVYFDGTDWVLDDSHLML